MRKGGKTVLIILAIFSVLFIASIFLLPQWWSSLFSPSSTPASVAPPVTPPSAPSNLMAQAVSQSQVELHWVDNSGNEDGFRIYRDNSVIATIGENANLYRDTGLKAATTYRYAIEAYNTAGGSEAVHCTITTRNPGITVTLDEIGVIFDHDPLTKGPGEIYLGIVVTDGVKTEEWEIPQQTEGIPEYILNDNESVSVNDQIFSTEEVGDYLRIFVIAYERDGSDFEMLVYQALGVAASTWMAGEVGMDLLGVFGASLGDLIGSFFGAEDDFVGSYERSWDKSSWWGAHVDLKTSYLNAGSDDLSLCFTIKSY